jgi:hypothetical protein
MALSTLDGFYRRTGPSRCKKYSKAGSLATTVGDVMKYKAASGVVAAATTGTEVLGICLQTTLAASTAPILIDIAFPGDEFQAKIETGTMAATEQGDEADINSDDGITLTESNGDCTITGWDGTNTDKCYVVFNNCEFGSPGVNVD